METASLAADAIPRPGPHHVFRWEARQQAYLLLYPEGLIKLNDTAGEILRRCDGSRPVEALVAELQQAFDAPVDQDEILVLGTDRSVERITVEHGPGGHFGGDPLLHRSLFVPESTDPMGQRAGARAGAMSVLTGVAATRSAETGQPVDIPPLLDGG